MKQREIKFRAWQYHIVKECWEMLEWEQIKRNSMHYLWETYTNRIVMQFTGLHDKNGKEIYEGDHDEDYQVVRWCENRNGWALAMYDFPTKDFIHCNCYRCEGNYEIDESPIVVTGNIYENPKIIR